MSVEDIFTEFVEEKAEEEKAEEKPEEKPEEEPVEVEVKPTEEKPPEEAKEEAPEEFFEEPTEEAKEVKEAPAEEFFGEAVEKPAEEAPAPTPRPAPKPAVEEKFDLSEAKGTGKIVFMIYGLKGHGKTDLAFSFPGKVACLSFDRKSLPIKVNRYKNDERIKVYDAIMYMNKDSAENYLESCDKTFRYTNALLDHIAKNFEPDWVVIDGSDILSRICEMTMRYRNNLMPFQGIANRNLWKERNLYIDQIHNKSTKIARRGVIYTAYTDAHEIVKEGEFIIKEDIPKWVGDIMTETDVVIKVESVRDKSGGQTFFATVESSKNKRIPTGKREDVTNVGVKALVRSD